MERHDEGERIVFGYRCPSIPQARPDEFSRDLAARHSASGVSIMSTSLLAFGRDLADALILDHEGVA